MGYFSWVEKRMLKLRWYDIVMVKWCAVVFGLLLAKLWPPILSLNMGWYALLVILLAAIPTYKFYWGK